MRRCRPPPRSRRPRRPPRMPGSSRLVRPPAAGVPSRGCAGSRTSMSIEHVNGRIGQSLPDSPATTRSGCGRCSWWTWTASTCSTSRRASTPARTTARRATSTRTSCAPTSSMPADFVLPAVVDRRPRGGGGRRRHRASVVDLAGVGDRARPDAPGRRGACCGPGATRSGVPDRAAHDEPTTRAAAANGGSTSRASPRRGAVAGRTACWARSVRPARDGHVSARTPATTSTSQRSRRSLTPRQSRDRWTVRRTCGTSGRCRPDRRLGSIVPARARS